MNAKEMFEELGYNTFKFENPKNGLRFRRCYDEWEYYKVDITFYNINKKKKGFYEIDGQVTVEVHKAIHKQLLELGWLDE